MGSRSNRMKSWIVVVALVLGVAGLFVAVRTTGRAGFGVHHAATPDASRTHRDEAAAPETSPSKAAVPEQRLGAVDSDAHPSNDDSADPTPIDRPDVTRDLADRRRGESLDDAPARVVAERLGAAIVRAKAERGVPIASRIVDLVIDDGAVPIIVMLTESQPALEPRLAGTRHEPAHYFNNIPFAAIEVGPQALLEIVESHDILSIEEDRKHSPSLAATVPLISADAAHAAGYDGSGQTLAILDTGIDLTHAAFAGRLVDEACFSRNGSCPGGGTREFGPGTGAPCALDCDHGTLVAGVALGLDPADVRNGVAPDSGLVSIMVFTDEGGEAVAYASDIIAGLDHVYDMRLFWNTAAVNLSLGGDLFSTTADCDAANLARKSAIDRLRSIGIATIVASGNDADTSQLSEPACISTAVSVGATTKSDVVPAFSNSADFLSLLAPGAAVETTRQGGGFTLSGGTSIAAPHVAGAWAAILEAVPGSNVAEVLFALQSTGRPIVDDRNQITTPRIDVAAAIMALDSGIDIDDPVTNNGGGIPLTVPPPALPSSACGLIGLELLLPYGLVRLARRRLQRRGCRNA